MVKHLWVYILLALTCLLPACAFGQPSKPILPDKTVPPAQAQPSATPVEKVVTLVPVEDQAAPAPTTTAPSNRIIDEKAQETITANLRALLGDPQLELALKALDRSPNATNYPALLFVDPQGNSYYISPDTLQPIEFTQERPVQNAQGASKTPDELRAIAGQLAEAHSTRFEALKDKLAYQEGNKGGEYNFFRWEMPGSDVGGMPAILQIGLRQDGSLFAYLNSLDLLP